MSFNPVNYVWTEKYRPRKVGDVVGEFKDKISKYLENPQALPHFLFYSKTPGTGKTSLSKAIINELGCDSLIINSSDDRKIEVIREKVKEFSLTQSSKPELKKCVFLDEADGMCLPYNATVMTGSKKRPFIRQIDNITRKKYIMFPSINILTEEIEDDKGIVVDSRMADFFEIELEDGRKIVASANHPFFKKKFIEIKVKELKIGDEIIDMSDNIFKNCPICNKHILLYKTTCSKNCQNKLHSQNMNGKGNPRYGIKLSKYIKKAISKANKGHIEPEWKRKQQSEFMKLNNPMNNLISRQKISLALKGRNRPKIWCKNISNGLNRHRGTEIYEKYCIEHNLPYSYKHQKLKRKKVICQICNKFLKKDSDRHMHHINKNRKDNSDENILDSCNRCHNHIHLGYKYKNHSIWIKQYADKIKNLGIILYGEKK